MCSCRIGFYPGDVRNHKQKSNCCFCSVLSLRERLFIFSSSLFLCPWVWIFCWFAYFHFHVFTVVIASIQTQIFNLVVPARLVSTERSEWIGRNIAWKTDCTWSKEFEWRQNKRKYFYQSKHQKWMHFRDTRMSNRISVSAICTDRNSGKYG